MNRSRRSVNGKTDEKVQVMTNKSQKQDRHGEVHEYGDSEVCG